MKSIIQSKKECYLTHDTVGLDKHHIFNGALRKWAENEGLWVYLRHDIHMLVHERANLRLDLKRIGQEAWEQKYKDKYKNVREAFIKRTGTNYL